MKKHGAQYLKPSHFPFFTFFTILLALNGQANASVQIISDVDDIFKIMNIGHRIASGQIRMIYPRFAQCPRRLDWNIPSDVSIKARIEFMMERLEDYCEMRERRKIQ